MFAGPPIHSCLVPLLLSTSLFFSAGVMLGVHQRNPGTKLITVSSSPALDATMSLNHHGLELCNEGKDRAAIPYFKHALQTMELERYNAKTRTIMLAAINSNIAKTYHRLGQYSEAEPFYAAALAGREVAFGMKSDLTALVHLQLAILRFDQNNFASARSHLSTAVAMNIRDTEPASPLADHDDFDNAVAKKLIVLTDKNETGEIRSVTKRLKSKILAAECRACYPARSPAGQDN